MPMKPSAALLASDLVRLGVMRTPTITRPSRRIYAPLGERAPPYDPTAAANNAARLKRIEWEHESGQRCDRPRDLEERS